MSAILNAAIATQVLESIRAKAKAGQTLTADEVNQMLAHVETLDTVPWTEEGADHTVIDMTATQEDAMSAPKQTDQEWASKLAIAADEFGKKVNKHHHKKHKGPKPFVPTIGGLQLQPRTEKVFGMIIVPEFNDKNEVVGIHAKHGEIEVAVASAFRAIPNMQYATIASEDAGVKAQVLWRYIREVNKNDRKNGKPEEEWRIPVGNLKKGCCVIGLLTKREWDAFFGCDIRLLNLWKVILPVMTPTTVEVAPQYSNIQTMRMRILDSLVTPGGYPEHDGDVVTKVRHEFYRHCDLVEGAPKEGAKVKKVNRNWQMRASGLDVNGKIMPLIKAKVYSDDEQYERLAQRFGFDPNAQDAFVTKDNLKSLKWLYKHGDILEVPITNIRNVKAKMKDWSSSMGAQCIANSDMLRTKEVLHGHNILDKANTIKGASELKLRETVAVMESDQEAAWDDALSMPVKCMFSRFVDGDWFVPRMNKDTFFTRLESYYKEYGIKVRLAKDGYYIQGDERLDELENKHEAETGKLQYYCWLPKTAKFVNKLKVGDKIDLGRDPNVGPSNLMTFIVAGFNESLDAIVMSWQSIYAMYGDVDGDTVKYEDLIANTSDRMFPCLRRPAPGASPEKPVPTTLPSLAEFLKQHEVIGLGVLKSAADTGSLDLTCRQIIEERMYAENMITLSELMQLSKIRQDAIEGLKHTDSGVSVDAKDEIIKTYGVNGKMAKTKDAPMTYRLLRKDAGKPYLSETRRFEERIKLINECKPHAMHPYADFFNSLKGIKTVAKGADIQDSEWLFKQCYTIWQECLANHKKGAYSWTAQRVIEMGNWMDSDYRANARAFIAYTDEDARKEAFTKLKETHRSLVAQKCVDLFGADAFTNPEKFEQAVKYQRQLTTYLGVKGFGRSFREKYDKQRDMEVKEAYGKGGGAMWNMLEEHTLYLAEYINKRAVARGEFPDMNPFMDKIKEALKRNREKAAQKALMKQEAFIDNHN